MCLRLLPFLCPASECCREGQAWSGEVGRDNFSRCSPGCPLRFFLHLLRVSAAPIIGGMLVSSFRQLAVAACWLPIPSQSESQNQSHIATDGQSISKSWHHAPSGTHDQIFITLYIYGLVFVKPPLWREDGSVFCVSRVRVSWDSWPYFTVSHLRLPFRRLLRLAGSRWRYSTRLHTGVPIPKPKSKLLYDWRLTANQFVLASSPLRLTTRDFSPNWTLMILVLT
jgi:hypothetical protein